MGGVVIDLMRLGFGDAFLAYATLFALEIVILVAAFVLTTRLDIQESRAVQEIAPEPA
jgi:hypothetical protein